MRLYSRRLSPSRVTLVVLGMCILVTVIRRLRYMRDVNSTPPQLIIGNPRDLSKNIQTQSTKSKVAIVKLDEAADTKRRLADKLAKDKQKAESDAEKLKNDTVRKTETGIKNTTDKIIDESKSEDYNPLTHQQEKLAAYKDALEFEEKFSNRTTLNLLQFGHVIKTAKQIASHSKNTVLLSIVDDASIPFVNSWICNTNRIVSYKLVLFVTLDAASNKKLIKYWPKLNVVAMDTSTTGASSSIKDIGHTKKTLRKVELIHTLLRAGICLLIIDVHSVWFNNPMPYLYTLFDNGFDMAVNLVSNSHINTGFLFLGATQQVHEFWSHLYKKLMKMEPAWSNKDSKFRTTFEDYYELSMMFMVRSRDGGIVPKELPLTSYTDGGWYMLSDAERKRTHPVVIRNNFLQANETAIDRAKKWNHWFLLSDGTCDVNLTLKTIGL